MPTTNGSSAPATIEPGQPITKRSLFGALGQTGLSRWGGYITGEDYLPQLEGVHGRRIFREMAQNDPTLGAALLAIRLLSRQVEWHVEPADCGDDAAPDQLDAAQEAADFCESCLYDMSTNWEDTLAEIFTMLVYGWSYFEIVAKMRNGPHDEDPTQNSKHDDGLIGIRKVEIRAQDSLDHWEFDEGGGIQGMWQMAPPHFILTYLPIDKCLLFRTETRKNNPEGVSLLRSAYRPWYFKQQMEVVEGIGVERDLAGLPVGLVPAPILAADATADEVALRTELKRIITSIKRDDQEGVLWPSARDESGHLIYELTLLSSPGQRQLDISGTIQRKKEEQLATFLADFMLLGHEQAGSWALATSKTSLFTTALASFLDSIAAVISEYLFTRILKWNQMDASLRPELKHGEIEAVDLAALGGFIKSLGDAGAPIFPNPELLKFLLEKAHLPTEHIDEMEAEQTLPPGIVAPGAPPPAAGGVAPQPGMQEVADAVPAEPPAVEPVTA